jgi:hypothetical protein
MSGTAKGFGLGLGEKSNPTYNNMSNNGFNLLALSSNNLY